MSSSLLETLHNITCVTNPHEGLWDSSLSLFLFFTLPVTNPHEGLWEPCLLYQGQQRRVTNPHEGLWESKWVRCEESWRALRIPMRGYETLASNTGFRASELLRIPMRGYEVLDAGASRWSAKLRIPMRGYERKLQQWQQIRTLGYESPWGVMRKKQRVD